MKVLITGANGFLGHYLVKQLLDKKMEVIATGKGPSRLPFSNLANFHYYPMDFTDPFSVHDAFEQIKPDVVVHAGAMSKPDDCEKEQWPAYQTNVEGTLNLLVNAEECKSFFVFVSTDFIFDGYTGMYREDDIPNPINFYGKTKLEAEEAVREYKFDWCIVRTVLVYGKPLSGRDNILSLVKQKLEKEESYQVFDDQLRTPTYVEDLASAMVTIIEKRSTGVYHISGADPLTPYEMACTAAEYLQLDKSLIIRATAETLQQPAKRPQRTGFVIDKAKKQLGFNPVSFKEGMKKTFDH
jgi:dTDP-4-dehydrorhamnose reductase